MNKIRGNQSNQRSGSRPSDTLESAGLLWPALYGGRLEQVLAASHRLNASHGKGVRHFSAVGRAVSLDVAGFAAKQIAAEELVADNLAALADSN